MALSPLPLSEVKRQLEAAGFGVVTENGSQVKFARDLPTAKLTVVVPRHRKIPPGTLRSILRQASLTEDGFGLL